MVSGISEADVEVADGPVELFTVGGQKIGVFNSIGEAGLDGGIYIYRRGARSGKIVL